MADKANQQQAVEAIVKCLRGQERKVYMKHIKKVVTLALAFAMVLSMSVFCVYAAAPTTGTITIIDSADGTVDASTRTFKAYRILNATEVFGDGDDQPATGYAYSIPNANIRAALANKFLAAGEKEQGATETIQQYDARIIAAVEAAGAQATIEQTAKDLLQIAKECNVAPIDLSGEVASEAIPFGYYVIEDVTNPAQQNVSAVMLDTNNPNVTIKVKASKPSLEKKIDEGQTAGAIDAQDVEYDNHRIGDTVPYILQTAIPEMTGYTKYFFNVNDTLSKGLTFNNDVVIKVTKAAIENDPSTDVDESADAVVRTLVKDTDYTVTATTNNDGTTSLEIVFKDFYNKEKAHAGEEMIITYSATINKDAVIGVEGNPNEAMLVFSNNPNETVDHDPDNPDKPHEDAVIGETPKEKTYTYVTGVSLKKVDPSGKPLAGATFELSGNLNKVEVYKSENFVQDADGVYFALKDGSYTTVDPTTLNPEASNYDELIAKYVDPTGATKYKKASASEKTASGTPKTVSETTGATGIVIFDGMGDGTFTLTETAAPTGYNPLPTPINFEVVWNAPTGNSTDCSWTVKNVTEGYGVRFNETTGEFEITIENQTGTELPSTGGIGTVIFYVLGTLLVVGCGIVLISKRRMLNK